MNCKISVVMAVYNEENYLRDSIESILNQTFTDFEFIIIDDGSTDKSSKIIESYKDNRIQFFKNEKKGIVKQLNFGINVANSQIIARMDADDIAERNRFKEHNRRNEAIPLFEEALRLNPKPQNVYLRHYAAALRNLGRYEDAIAQAKKAIEKETNDLIAWIFLTSSYNLAGREKDARAAAKEILRINPQFSVASIKKTSPNQDRAPVKRFCDALLRIAGLPD